MHKEVEDFIKLKRKLIQLDVKFVSLIDPPGKNVCRYQNTAIDDATRIRALKIYERHNQLNAINFIEYVIEKFPFLIHTIFGYLRKQLEN